jgi:hypothetical protein
MKPTFIRWWPLMAGLLVTLSADAQSLEDSVAGESARKAAPAPALCSRAYCGDVAAFAEQAAANVAPTMHARASWHRSGEREWKDYMPMREGREDYNCLLSAGFGGELRSHGYQGMKLLGQTRTLNLPGDKAAK